MGATAAGKSKVVVVTGGSSGIGERLVASLRARGDRVIAPTRADVDLADGNAIDAWADAAGIERLDGLVHCAGVVDLGSVAEFDRAAWESTLAINLLAPAQLTAALLPALRAGAASVVFVNSGAGLNAHPQWASYAASKFGLRALADSLRAEEPEVRVTSIFPGRVATRMQAEVHRQEGRTYDPASWIEPDTVVAEILRVLDLGPDAQIPEVVIRPR
ncbi:MAG: SDR family oxidoreductase [Marmoricola sp.]